MNIAPCRACGQQVSVQAPACPHCGQPSPTPRIANAQQNAQIRSGAILVGLLVLCFFGWRYSCNSFRDFSKEKDRESCEKNLSYYENFCKVYPNECVTESARKKARCE